MARYLFTVWSFPGHINPSLAAAAALRARGHAVAFYTGARAGATLQRLDIPHFPMRHVDEEILYRFLHAQHDDGVGRISSLTDARRMNATFRTFVVDPIPGQMADLEPVLNEWRPDAIICDPNLLAPYLILHETRGVPVAILSYTTGCMLSGPQAPPWGRGLPPPTTAARRLRASAEKAVSRQFVRPFMVPLNKLRTAHGLAPLTTWIADYAGTMPLYLVTSVPELDYQRHDLPANVHYVGRLAWDRPADAPTPPWIAALPTVPPLVYVTEGTVHGRQPLLLQAAARGLTGLPLQALLTLNAERDAHEAGLDALAANVRLERYHPGQGWQNDVLPRASLVVTNGGAGSVLAALAAGVPLVVAPTAWDKPENARRVVAAGAGVQIDARRLTPRRLRTAVQQVLGDPSFAANARRLAAAFARYDAPSRAADLLDNLCPTTPDRATTDRTTLDRATPAQVGRPP